MSITGNAQNVNINSGNLILTDSSKKVRTPKLEFPDGTYITSALGAGATPTFEQVIGQGNTVSNTVYFSNSTNALVIDSGKIHFNNDIIINSSASNVRIGTEAGASNQGSYGLAMGFCAGIISQGERGIALGTEAGASVQGVRAIAIGQEAGELSSGSDSIAIGYLAGNNGQGSQAIAIGMGAGLTSQHDNTIVLNATGTEVNSPATNTFVVKPVRHDTTSTSNLVAYNPTSGEITETSAKVEYLSGITSDVQTQLDGKQAAITGNFTIPNNGNLTLYNSINFTRTTGACYFQNPSASVVIFNGTSSNPWSETRNYVSNRHRFYVSGTERYRITSSGGANTFTGAHRNHESQSSHDLGDSVGYIVVSNGVVDDITIDEAIPRVELSSRSNAKNVFGVISSKDDFGNTFTQKSGYSENVFEKDYSSRKLIINSVGEGGIWVCNVNGNIDNGDYITTSNIAGIGMKQDDDILHNYTCAKATMSCDFSPSMVYKKVISGYDAVGRPTYENTTEIEQEYKTMELEDGIIAAFIACTYHCG